MKIFICSACGHIEFNSAPESCPVCYNKSFNQNDNIFTESEEKSKEAAVKHIPSVKVVKKCGIIPEETCTDIVVRIGETLHPMEEKHYITFIDCYIDDKYASRIFLTPATWASGVFHIKSPGSKVTVVERCNVHGYWKSDSAL